MFNKVRWYRVKINIIMLSKIEEILSNTGFLDYKKHIPIYKKHWEEYGKYRECENVLKLKLEKLEGWNTFFSFIFFILFFLNFKIINEVPVLGIFILVIIIWGFSKINDITNFTTSGKYALIKGQIKEVENKLNIERNILIGYESKVKEYYERELNDFYHENLYKKRAKGEIYFNNLDLFLNKIKVADSVSREMLFSRIRIESHLDYALSKEWYRENRNNNVNYSKKEIDNDKSNTYINNQNINNSIEKQYIKKEIISNHEKYRVARKIDWDQVNKSKSLIGKKGEEIVFLLEKEYLIEIGREDLADKVRHISKEEGDGLGYDIFSFFKNGKEKYIEVKSTTIENSNSFIITKNELDFLEKNRKNTFIYKVYISGTEKPKLKVILAEDMLSDSEIIPNRYKVVL